ncbi:MAG: Hsp20/alpha crystallin family protein [Ignavibacteriaceae bacterium]
MAIVRWNPAREMLNIEREFNRIFNSFGFKAGTESGDQEYENAVWSPLADITEDKDNYTLALDIPGVPKDDVKISFNNGQLTITGERKQEKEEKDKNYFRVERSYGKFYRSFNLPKEIKEDQIEAQFKDGQLSITVPKAEKVKPKEISIKVS